MIDEGTLRKSYPYIAWDQPAELTILSATDEGVALTAWACRYCIAMDGVTAQRIFRGEEPATFPSRAEAMDHIERVHHD